MLDDESDMDLVADYCLYEYRVGGKNAVERFVARGKAEVGSDEHVVLQAMVDARFTLVEITEIITGIGAHAFDRIYEEPFLLADFGLSKTASPGLVLATRMLPLPTFTMTSGAPITIDPKLTALFVDGLRGTFAQPALVAALPAQERKQLARSLVTLAREDPEEVKAIWREKLSGLI